jgi:hypothetical protein
MSPTDRRIRPLAGVLPAWFASLAALALLLAAPASALAPEPSTAAPSASAPVATGPSAEGEALLERYTAEALSESVLLRPRVENPAVRSIEIDSEGSVLVNGKDFDEQELVGFLGEDGKRVAALARLNFSALRAALGLAQEEEEPAGVEAPAPPAGPAAPHSPRPPRVPRFGGAGRDDRVSVGRSIHVAAGETARDVVCVGCSVEVEGEAFGDAVAVGGTVDVSGTVHGDAVAIGGGVNVGENAEVQGEATSVGGTVDVAEGGRVVGKRASIGVGGPMFGPWSRHGFKFPFGVFGDVGRLLAAIFRTGILTLLGVLAFVMLRPAVERAARRSREEPWKALLTGLLVQLLFLPVLVLVTVVLAVSIIGIPLLALVPVALLAFVIAALVGFTGVARAVGVWVEQRTHGRFSSDILAVVVGLLLIQSVSLVGRLFSLPGGVFAFVGFSIVCLGFFLKYVAWTIGLGSMTLSFFARDWRRPQEAVAAPAPAVGALEEETAPGTQAPPPPPPIDPAS